MTKTEGSVAVCRRFTTGSCLQIIKAFLPNLHF